jgi:hypothetical protein
VSASFVYQAPASCPPEDDFRQRVARWLDPTAPALAEGNLRLEESPAEQGDRAYQGHASLPKSGAARDLHAATCEELVTAFAFVFAVDLDERVLERKKPEPLPVPSTQPPALPPAPAAHPRHLEASLGVLTGAGAGLLPHATPLEGLEIEARSAGDGVVDAGLAYSPRLRLGLALDTPAEATASSSAADATARFIGLRVRLDACPLALTQSILDVSACARAETDLILVSGIDLSASRSATDVLLGLGGSARVAFPLASRWSAGVDGGLVAPLARDRFTAYQGRASLFTTGLLTGSAQAFVAWRFH